MGSGCNLSGIGVKELGGGGGTCMAVVTSASLTASAPASSRRVIGQVFSPGAAACHPAWPLPPCVLGRLRGGGGGGRRGAEQRPWVTRRRPRPATHLKRVHRARWAGGEGRPLPGIQGPLPNGPRLIRMSWIDGWRTFCTNYMRWSS
jgi:hypothetical protein